MHLPYFNSIFIDEQFSQRILEKQWNLNYLFSRFSKIETNAITQKFQYIKYFKRNAKKLSEILHIFDKEKTLV